MNSLYKEELKSLISAAKAERISSFKEYMKDHAVPIMASSGGGSVCLYSADISEEGIDAGEFSDWLTSEGIYNIFTNNGAALTISLT
jgi:hypothetical protein